MNAPTVPAPTVPAPAPAARRPKVLWLGHGMFTQKKFKELMLHTYPEHVYWRMRGDTVIPPGKIKRNDIDGWMAFTGATWTPGR